MLAGILTHLNDSLPAERWAGVDIAEDVDALADMAGRIDDSSAIIMPFRERAGPNPVATGGFRQRVETQFAVGIVIRNYDDTMGETRATRFDALKKDVETALAGWQPPGCTEPCELIGGESSPISKGVSIYVQTWATARNLTGVAA